MTQFKRHTTGRIYDFEQVLYSSILRTGCDEWGDIYQVVLLDPSRHLSYLYNNVSFLETGSDLLSLYDNGRGEFISYNDERYKAIINHFNLNEG